MIPYDKREGKIWYNNDLVDWQEVKLHVLSHGLHYGSFVFEGLRVYDGEIFKLEEHTDRLYHSAKRMGIKIPYSKDEINKAAKKIVSVQNVQNGYIRPFAWRGSEMMAISAQQTKIHVAIATWEWGSYFDPKLKTEGIKLNISKWRRPAPNTIPWDTKASGLYMICTLSKHEAEQQGYTDSLMLDHEDNVAEATGANIFFKDKEVAVIGGGNAAVEEAIFLTKFATKVRLIHRRDKLRAEKMLQKKLMGNKKIEIIWDTVLEEVIGDKDPKGVTGIKIKNIKTNKSSEIKLHGLFIAIGHDPATSLFKDQLDMDKEGYLITKPDSTVTNIPGVFAAGDVKDKIFRQAVTAAGMGCISALEVEKFLSKQN